MGTISSIASGDLEIARQWLLAGIEKKRGFLAFEKERAYLESLTPKHLSQIALTADKHTPQNIEVIHVPKSGREFRSVPWINVGDNLIATATVAASYPILQSSLAEYQGAVDYRNLLPEDPKSIEWVGTRHKDFLDFKNRIRTSEQDGKFVYQGDIRAFGPSCNISKILNTLGEIGMAEEHRALLESYLLAWSSSPDINMPDGTVLIDFLLKVALLPVDEECVNSGLEYFRYGDDVCLVAATQEGLESSISVLRGIVEAEGFKLNERKARITGPNINEQSLYLDHFFDPVMSDMGYASKFTDLDTNNVPVDVLEAVYEQHVSPRRDGSGYVWQTVFNFTLGRLGSTGSQIAFDDLPALLSSYPDRARRIFTYVGRAGFNDQALEQISSHLNSEEPEVAYHRYVLCDVLKDPDICVPQSMRTMVLAWQDDISQPSFVKQASAELIGHPRFESELSCHFG